MSDRRRMSDPSDTSGYHVYPPEPGSRRAARRAARGGDQRSSFGGAQGYEGRRHAAGPSPAPPDHATGPRRRSDAGPRYDQPGPGQGHEQGRRERGYDQPSGGRQAPSRQRAPQQSAAQHREDQHREDQHREEQHRTPPKAAPQRPSRQYGPAEGGPPPPGDTSDGHRRGDDGGKKKMRMLAWGSIALTGLMVAGTLTGYTLYRSVSAGIETEDFNAKLGKDRPVNSTGALNVLMVGSDTREGDNLKYGKYMLNAGKRTDTMILMHISPNRDNATLISFPRDSVVAIPACPGPNGTTLPPKTDMINAAYNEGGITCTIATLESLTKVRIDHFVEVDFTGFKNIVDALDGIRVCLKQPVNDRKAKLDLAAGWHNLKGEQALGYVRLRNYGDGSDIQRIKRQQVFLSQVVKKATSSDLITDPTKLLSFITAATKSVKMNPELANSPDTLLSIAQSARALTSSGVQFITVPWGPHPDDKNRVIWREPAASQLFDAIKRDVEVKPTTTPKPSTGTTTAPAKPAIKPAQVRVQVLNGTSVEGRAKEVADALVAQGFQVTQVGNARIGGVDAPKTRLLYAKNAESGADYATPIASKLLSKVSPQSGKIKPVSVEAYVPTTPSTSPNSAKTASPPANTGGEAANTPVIQLVVGADWEGVKAPVKIPDELKESVVNSKTNPCQ
ncbi:LCP family protein [Spongiactinospora sp. TRM90649]|uniref:LCP family protein n=1 Tax=Spongiactinospora sp. TRM90649 TaxID=3031114 RepID=UPI0023F7091E|nr:LCP family protein [Spongiactinospora sp. TRM90649]MDF5751188.1 LCP family protein [Spongiactinospora sp. TRM90649]